MTGDILFYIAEFCDAFTRSMLRFVSSDAYKKIQSPLTMKDITPYIFDLTPGHLDRLFKYYSQCLYRHCKDNKTNMYYVLINNFAAFEYCDKTYCNTMPYLFGEGVSIRQKKIFTITVSRKCATVKTYIQENISKDHLWQITGRSIRM